MFFFFGGGWRGYRAREGGERALKKVFYYRVVMKSLKIQPNYNMVIQKKNEINLESSFPLFWEARLRTPDCLNCRYGEAKTEYLETKTP